MARKGWWLGLLIAAAIPATASATTYQVPVDTPPGLAAQGFKATASLEVADEPAATKDGSRWHAKVFSGIRGCPETNHGWCVWAWNKGIVESWGGRFHFARQDAAKSSPGTSWKDGPYNTERWQDDNAPCDCGDHRRVYSHYWTDWKLGYAKWGVLLNLNQFWNRRVDRRVKWTHLAS